jgi:hypothetical protein
MTHSLAIRLNPANPNHHLGTITARGGAIALNSRRWPMVAHARESV